MTVCGQTWLLPTQDFPCHLAGELRVAGRRGKFTMSMDLVVGADRARALVVNAYQHTESRPLMTAAGDVWTGTVTVEGYPYFGRGVMRDGALHLELLGAAP